MKYMSVGKGLTTTICQRRLQKDVKSSPGSSTPVPRDTPEKCLPRARWPASSADSAIARTTPPELRGSMLRSLLGPAVQA
eukprot:10804297-Alexandrium_andersonii.AAC.1